MQPWKLAIKLAGPKNAAISLEGHGARWPAVSEDEEEDFNPDPCPAAHHWKQQCTGAVAVSPGPRVEQLE